MPTKPRQTTTRPAPRPAQPATRPAAPRQQQPAALVATPRVTTPAVVDELMEEMRRDAGLGVSTLARDNITPSISVLQPMSPLVLEGGAHPGDFMMANGDPPVVDGQEGFHFQPCCTTEWWFEFIPRDDGGGFVGRYPVTYDAKEQIIPPEGASPRDPENRFRFWFPDSGNECTHYRFIPGVVWRDGIGEEFVIQFHGTGHTVARNWNTSWTRKRFPDTGQMFPACSTIYHVRTAQRSNKKGTWYSVIYDGGTYVGLMKDVVGDPRAAYRRGKDLARAFKSGELVEGVTQEYDDATTTGGDGSGQQQPKADEELPY